MDAVVEIAPGLREMVDDMVAKRGPEPMDAPQRGSRICVWVERDNEWRYCEVTQFDFSTKEHVLKYEPLLSADGIYLPIEPNQRVDLLELVWLPACVMCHPERARAKMSA